MAETWETLDTVETFANQMLVAGIALVVTIGCICYALGMPLVEMVPWPILGIGAWCAVFAVCMGLIAARDRDRTFAALAVMLAVFAAVTLMTGVYGLYL